MSSFMAHDKSQMQEPDQHKSLSRFDPLSSSNNTTENRLKTPNNLTKSGDRSNDIFVQNPPLSVTNPSVICEDVLHTANWQRSPDMYSAPMKMQQLETNMGGNIPELAQAFGSLPLGLPVQKGTHTTHARAPQKASNDLGKPPFSRSRTAPLNSRLSTTVDTQKSSRNHRRSKSIENPTDLVKMALAGHRKSKSVQNLCNLEVRGGDGILRSNSPKGSNPHTPSHSPHRRRIVKSITPSKLLRSRTKSKDGNTPKTSKSLISRSVIPDGKTHGLNLPLLAKPSPTSFLNDGNSFALRTSEQDPSAHQVELPKADELLLNIKLCVLMDANRAIENAYDVMSLVGHTNSSLNFFLSNGHSSSGLHNNHRIIIKQLLECNDGISVGGYAAKSAEVITFDIPSRSQIIVVFRGNDDQQSKPVKKPRHSMAEDLHSDQKVAVYSGFKEAYFELESMFSAMVDKLTDANPFAQVVFCGHSFGGALATIASVRYACNRPMMRVAAHVFGSPRVGSGGFRQLANSLSNLRIIRVELKNDSFVDLPVDGTTKWDHAGHSITIGKTVTAYRFDKNRPSSNNIFRKNEKKIFEKNIFRKNEKHSNGYCQALESRLSRKQWFETFYGENVGKGVRGKGDEKRLIS